MPRVARIHDFGGPDNVRIDDLPMQDPAPGDVRIQVSACALNRADEMRLSGFEAIKALLPDLPTRFGFECAGVVDALGSEVTRFQIGDRVNVCPYLAAGYGTTAESVLWPEFGVSHYPDHLSAEEATSVWMQYMTPWGALFEHGGMTATDTVLITAASSSTGIGAIQLVRDCGATAIATTRTSDKKTFLEEIGADHVIATEEEDLAARVMEITGGAGCRLIFDPIGGPFIDTLTACAAQRGWIFIYGFLAGAPTHLPFAGFEKETIIMPYSMSPLFLNPATRERGMRYCNARLRADAFRPVIDQVFKLDDIQDALRYLAQKSVRGKVVIVP